MADSSHVVDVLARPDGVGHVSGAGEYQHGEVARFVASSLDGSHFFQRWLIQDTGRRGPATVLENGRYGAEIDDSDPSEATLELPINSNLTVVAEFDDDVRVSLKVMPEKGGTARFADDSTEMFLSETEFYEGSLEIFVSAHSGFAFESVTCDGSTRRLNYKLEDEKRNDQKDVIRATCVVKDPPAGTYLVRFKQVGTDDPNHMRDMATDRPSTPSPSPSVGVAAPEPPEGDLSQPAPPSAPPMGGTGGSVDTDDVAAGLSPADIARPSVSAASDIVDVDDADDMRGSLSDDNGSLSSQGAGSRGSLSSGTSLSGTSEIETESEEDEGPSLASQAANMAKDALKEKAKHAAKMKLLALMAHPAFWIVVGVLLAFLLLYACASSCSGNSTDLENGSYSTSSITSDSPSAIEGQVVKQKRRNVNTPRVTGDWEGLEAMFASDEDEENEDDSGGNGDAGSSELRQQIIEKARSYIGVPYVWGGKSPSGFDCSGLTTYCYEECGVDVGGNRTTYDLISWIQSKGNWKEDQSQLQPGDMVFPSSGHVAIYIGDNRIIHAPHEGASVCEAPLYAFIGGGWAGATPPPANSKSKSGGKISDGNISSKQQQVIDSCKTTPSAGQGYCAAWVTNVFANCGINFGGNACDQYDEWCHSSNRSELKPGMVVAIRQHSLTSAGSTYGHVGIYVGDGNIMDNIGYIRTEPVTDWIDRYNAAGINCETKWGWGGGVDLTK